jgi:two-component system nitrogen regulation response regulator NtrX
MANILVIEDEESIRRVLSRILKEENKLYEITEAVDGKSGLEEILKNKFDLVLCDIKMPIFDGIEVLKRALKNSPDLPFIMLTGHGNVETAVQAMKFGAYDFISKPPDLNRLLTSVRNALEKKSLKNENKKLKKIINQQYEIIGNSDAINNVKNIIKKVANTEARVLITGASGTGKELVARQLHKQSNRCKESFIEVNCAAIPSELIESELFGHVKGSFTSALKDRSGKFQAAHNGTIFLDEIADMSLAAQAKVLRALQENKIQRVGSDQTISVNVRVVAATNKDLEKEINNGNFRADLYHRLAVILIKVPSLEERKEDIPLLSEYFIKSISKHEGREIKSLSKEAFIELQKYSWTGNIRELRNVIERLMILGDTPITKNDILKYASKE